MREILSAGAKTKASSKRRAKRRRGGAGNGMIETDANGGNRESELAPDALDALGRRRKDSPDGPGGIASTGGAGASLDRTEAAAGVGHGPLPEGGVGGSSESVVQTGVEKAGETALDTGGGEGATAPPSGVLDNVNGGTNDSGCNDDPFGLLSPENLASYDVVLTTFEVLRAEVHHSESKFSGAGGGAGANGTDKPGGGRGQNLRRKKRLVIAARRQVGALQSEECCFVLTFSDECSP